MESLVEEITSDTGCPVSCNKLTEASDSATTCNTDGDHLQQAVDWTQKDTNSITKYVVIDSISTDFDMAILGIKKAKVVGMAMEGVRDGRLGRLCWLQIGLDDYTFLFDMLSLKSEAFDEGLRDIIEDYNIVKVVHDCRGMSDYLLSRHGIRLSNVFDTQVADLVLFRTRNVDLLPVRVNSLTVCLMMHLGLPSTLFSTRYLKVLRDESPETWKLRPAPDAVLEAAVFRVCYLAKLRLRLIELLLKRFTDGCDVYLGLMRDAGDKQILRLENQAHLVPSEFEDLAFFAESSRRRREDLRRREVSLRPRTICDVPIQSGSCATFFNGGSKLCDMVLHGVGISDIATALGATEDDVDDDEDDLDDDSLIRDVDYRMLMQGVDDTLDDLCQKEVDEGDDSANDVNIKSLLDVNFEFKSGGVRNEVIDTESGLKITMPEVDLKKQCFTNDLPSKVTDDLVFRDSNEHVLKLDVAGEMSRRSDSVTVGGDNAGNLVTGCNIRFANLRQEVTGSQGKMLGRRLDESRLENPVESLKSLIRSLGTPGGCLGKKRVTFLEKPVLSLEKPDGSLEKVIGSSETPVETLETSDGSMEKLGRSFEKPVGCLEKLIDGPEVPVGILNKSNGSLAKLVSFSVKPIRCLDEPVGSLEKLVRNSAKLDGQSEKLDGQSEKLVGDSEKLAGHLDKLVHHSEKLVGDSEKLVGNSESAICLDETVGYSEELVGYSKEPVSCSEEQVNASALISEKTEVNTQQSDDFVPISEKFTGLRNLPNSNRFVPRDNRAPYVPRRHNFRSPRNFRGARSEWMDGGHSGDESPDSPIGVNSRLNSDDLGGHAPLSENECSFAEQFDSVGDSCDVVGGDVGENPVCEDGQNTVDEVLGEDAVGEVNNRGSRIDCFRLGDCTLSDRVAETSPIQGLVRSRLPKGFADDILGKTLTQAPAVQDGFKKGLGDGIKRLDLAACGRGKALAKAVELLQMRRA